MIALIQRTSRAQVTADGRVVAQIGRGVLALVGIEAADTSQMATKLVTRILTYRIFADEGGKMNRNLGEVGGELLLVPQFTLAADTRTGTRPGFSRAAPPDRAQRLYGEVVAAAAMQYGRTASGIFGADMQVELVNDGPVTFWLQASAR